MSNRLQRLHASILCGTAKISGAPNPNNIFYPLGRHRPGRLSAGFELSAPVSHEYFIFALSALAPRCDRLSHGGRDAEGHDAEGHDAG